MSSPSAPLELAHCRVAVIGLGLMGGSLALALRGQCNSLLGVDVDPEIVALALKRGIVDKASTDLSTILPGADLVVLAAPVLAILNLLKGLPQAHPGRAVVLDLGSTKARILEAMNGLPERFDPIGDRKSTRLNSSH
jgi:prephenate dehydrogenase